MTKVSLVLYYWILVAGVLLFARTAGLAEDNESIIKILIAVTILYVGIAIISRSAGKALEEKRAKEGRGKGAVSQSSRKKKKRK